MQRRDHRSRVSAALLAMTLAASPAFAQEEEEQAASVTPAPMLAVARGLFLEVRVGGGYMLAGQKLEADAQFPELEGKPEGLGAGALMHLALGFDLADAIALQVVGGSTLVSGTRADRVRDLGLMFGGAGLRLALDLGERLDLVLAGAGVYVRSDDGVDKATLGAGVLANVGLEYYVHVRHFSIGLDVSVLAPLSPQRVFVGVGPQLKYTF